MAGKYDGLAKVIIQNVGGKGEYTFLRTLFYTSALPAEG